MDAPCESFNLHRGPFQFLFVMSNFAVCFSTEVIQPAMKFFILLLKVSELSFNLSDLLFVNVDLLSCFDLEFLHNLHFALFCLASDVLIFFLQFIQFSDNFFHFLLELQESFSQFFIFPTKSRKVLIISRLSCIDLTFIFAYDVNFSLLDLIFQHEIFVRKVFEVDGQLLKISILCMQGLLVFLEDLFELSILFLGCIKVLLQCANRPCGFNFVLLGDGVLNFNNVSSEILVFSRWVP